MNKELKLERDQGARLSSGAQTPVPTFETNLPFETLLLREGDVLFKEGEQPRGLYYVQSGCVKVVVNRQQSRGRTTSPEYVTKLVSPGEYFGYKAIVKNVLSRSTAKAVKDSVLWLYPHDLVKRALGQASPLVKLLLEQSVADIENFETTSQLNYLASVQERIAYQLVILSEKFGVQTPFGISINLKITRNEFAQLASTINESLSRHLTEFKNEGLLDINGKEIIIRNLAALKRKCLPTFQSTIG